LKRNGWSIRHEKQRGGAIVAVAMPAQAPALTM